MPPHLTIEPRVLGDLLAHARGSRQSEACGALLGRSGLPVGRSNRAGWTPATVVGSLRATNAAHDDRHAFLIEAAELRSLERAARAHNLEMVGFYHSHPRGDARPSTTDLELALPGWAYLIIAGADTSRPEFRAWRLRADRSRFDELTLGAGAPARTRATA